MNIRTGFGIDVHKFSEGRKLIIGGVEIPFEKGLLGHSDADILLHAIADALLGSLALGDIGILFPDTDQKNKDIDSRIILKTAYQLVQEHGYELCNIDTMITAQRPKLSPYIPRMKDEISAVLGCSPGQISIKATTTEKLGFAGREEGIAAFASVLVTYKAV
jgi:2-C-methyl-D-erythritol 2,4-cyclodiphosphate synthase